MSASRKRNRPLEVDEESPKRARKVVEVVSDGDVLLKVGRGADVVDIRVYGTVISLASDFFSRMLSSSYIEARTKEIVLAKDDPEVVLDFCNIVHHKIENLDHCDGSRILKLAELADARLCVRTLRPWIATRLTTLLDAFKDKDLYRWASPGEATLRGVSLPLLDIEQCIAVATIFNFEDLFWFATKHAVLSSQYPLKSCKIPSFADPALGWSLQSFQEQLEKVRTQQLHGFLDDVFKCVGEHFDTGTICPSSLEDRSCLFTRYGAIMLYLAKNGIKPGQVGKYQKSISRAMDDVRGLHEQRLDSPWDSALYHQECTMGLDDKCAFCDRNISKDLLEVIERHMRTALGACLVCITSRREKVFHDTRNHEKH